MYRIGSGNRELKKRQKARENAAKKAAKVRSLTSSVRCASSLTFLLSPRALCLFSSTSSLHPLDAPARIRMR